jgi:putative DNA primase/helicase
MALGRWESWATPRPLYGLQGLAERPDAQVVVTEGEKAADAAGTLLPAMVAVTSPNGSKSAGKADWSPLHGRRLVIWPDADSAGLARNRCRSVERFARLAAGRS